VLNIAAENETFIDNVLIATILIITVMVYSYNTTTTTMGGACGAYGGGERCAQGSGGET
jgi:hypothetical protein